MKIEFHEPRRLENGDFYRVTITFDNGCRIFCPNEHYASEFIKAFNLK